MQTDYQWNRQARKPNRIKRGSGYFPAALLYTWIFWILILCAGCFDYEERIVLQSNFSGSVEVFYDIPIYPNENRSLLKFLPLGQAAVEKRLERSVQNYSEVIREEGDEGLSRRRARVNYIVAFKNPEDLAEILPGKTRIIFRQGRLLIERNFPAGKAIAGDADRFEQNIHKRVNKTLENRHMDFYINVPPGFIINSSHGKLEAPGESHYRYALKESMKNGRAIRWRLEVKAPL